MNDALPTLAVTGATGAVGGLVARALAAAGIAQRMIVRDAARAPQLPHAAVVEAEYGDAEASARVLEGVDTLFLVSATESADRLEQQRSFVEQAAKAGVRHIVYTSFFGAAPDAVFTLARDHWATERHIYDEGIAHTFLRDNLYLDLLEQFAGEDGVIRGPADRGRVAAVSRADVARSAVAVLRDPSPHVGHTYELTGPEALTLDEAARILTTGLGRPVRFENETMDEAYASRAGYQAPQWQQDAWVSTYRAIAAGELERTTRDVERLTGRRPLGLAQLLASR